MKISLSIVQLIIRLLILAILFVVLFMISLTLYSTKFWPDVHRYMNANITIKRIPTLTEINCELYQDRVTENYDGYTTTENYDELMSTTTFEIDDGFSLDDIDFERKKRSMEEAKDYNEVPAKTVVVDYFFDLADDGVQDLIRESELTTRVHDVEMLVGNYGVKVRSMEANNIAKELTSVVYPWLATIFIKDNSSDEFKYYCDGAFLTYKAVITAAGCIRRNDLTTNPEDIIVIAGKKSLTNMMGTEIAVRIKEIKAHANFTAVKKGNDLAILILEEPVTLSDNVQVAHLHREVSTVEYIVTTGWQTTGDLTPILLTNGGERNCGVEASVEDVFCAVYGNDVTVCPSYGGLYVTKDETWHLQGLRTADPEDRGLCFDRNIAFTSFDQHWEWIKDNIE